ncbi:hypothetical protein [Agrococcus jenensis]|uniref:Uncharacterized protein n=1 Tax=Agrococcus jenensis TaxID=46353 RepID=A0A3N2AP70_9MICO|nr:hypothetical protein [Agrococcus jenensis]ROR64708.1 hypothetical protein EDD26_0054 [Agrococcus jenensis]
MEPSPAHVGFSEDHAATIVDELNACAPDAAGLGAWLARTGVETERIVTSTTLTYITLARRSEDGGRIVLMLLDGVWERAL